MSSFADKLPPLASLGRARVLVAGDVMLDRYWHGAVERISPEAPVPIVRVQREEERPGGAANVAMNIAALGAGVNLLAPVGLDEAAGRLETLLAGQGVSHQLLPDRACPTTVKLRVISQHQQLLRMDFEDQPAPHHIDGLMEAVQQACGQADLLVLSDYAKGALSEAPSLIAHARRQGLRVLVDPKGRDFARYRGAYLLTPNRLEFQTVVGPWRDEADFLARALALIEDLQLQSLLVTLGEGGMTLVLASGEHFHHPARAREVFDVTGAGDTVIATLAAALAAGWALDDAVTLANEAAGIVVGKLGAAAVSPAELAQALGRTE
ncbi:MAG: D-glycero-beta-D-manno-heptose-7-phosphate kinase [Pseudomonadota bacterium]